MSFSFGNAGAGATNNGNGTTRQSVFGSAGAAFGATPTAGSGGTQGFFGATPPPVGGFGTTTTARSATGNPTTAPSFGTPPPPSTSPFGGGATPAFRSGSTAGFGFGGGFSSTPSAFGTPTSSPFAAPKPTTATSGFGAFGAAPAPAQVQVGTGQPRYEGTQELDTGALLTLHAITRMSAFAHKSFEELQYEDCVKRTDPDKAQAIAAKNPPPITTSTGAFGTAGGFGAAPGAFGSTPPSGAGASLFGSAPTASSFGGAFGSKPSVTTPAANAFAAPKGNGVPATGGFSFGNFGGFRFDTTPPVTCSGVGAAKRGAFGTTSNFFFDTGSTQPTPPTTGVFFGHNTGANQPAGGTATKRPSSLPTDFRTQEVKGYLQRKGHDGKWEWRWFETSGPLLKYYMSPGCLFRAELNLTQATKIALTSDPGYLTIELNGNVYTLKASTQEEAAIWVKALLWRKAGGVIPQQSASTSRTDVLSALDGLSLDEGNSKTAPKVAASTTSSTTTKVHDKGSLPEKRLSFGGVNSLPFGAKTPSVAATTVPTNNVASATPSTGFSAGGVNNSPFAFSFGPPTAGSGESKTSGATQGDTFSKQTGTTGGFSFGSTPTQPPASVTGSLFGLKTSDASPSIGGSLSSGAETTTSCFSFDASSAKPVAPTTFTFGANTTTPTSGGSGGGGFGAGAFAGFGTQAFGGPTNGANAGIFGTTTAQTTRGTSLFGPTSTGASSVKASGATFTVAGAAGFTGASTNAGSQRNGPSLGGAKDAPPTTEELMERCCQVFEALPFSWAARVRLHHPWTGTPVLVGRTSLPESVESEMVDNLAFMHSQSATSGHKRKAGAATPFAGINYLRSIAEKQPFEEAALFTALELLEVLKTTTRDVEEKLEQYVSQTQECHPLVLLAMARLLTRSKRVWRVQPEELIELFQGLFPEAAKMWLSGPEQKLLTENTVGRKAATTTKPAHEESASVKEQWEKLKTEQKCVSAAMDELLKMAGLARVKRSALNMFKNALAFQRMTPAQRKKNARSMNYCFVGNPGTGKTTVAKLFARILNDSGMRRNSNVLLRGAQELKGNGVDKFRDEIKQAMGGVVFVDEAYELEPSSDPKGKAIVAEILVAAEEHRHDLSLILAGYKDDIQQKLYAYNDGVRSRFTEVMFDDFDEADLRVIWDGLLKEREWKCDDKVSTIACRRIARGAGKKGVGNARAVRQLFEHATGEAMAREYFYGVLELRSVDVIGERPSQNPKLAALVHEFNAKIGWKRIKERVKELIDLCDVNYERELIGRAPLPLAMNRLFLGNPGTGKTTCAALYGKLLKLLGFLSNGDVVLKTAADFVGEYRGHTQTKTNEILKLAKGKVLIIDEAYNLDDDSYGKQVLDVLVEKVHGSDTDDIAVILIGYEHQMTEMLRKQNPGLARRFPIEYAFYFDDYDDHELFEIFSSACERQNVDCPLAVAEEVIRILSMQRCLANFGNAGAVETLLKNAIANASRRPAQRGQTNILLQLEDTENEMSKRASTNGNDHEDPLQALESLYRMDNIKEDLSRLRTTFKVAEKEGGKRPEIGHFVFRGSPGTGKTTVARTMGKILHRMGLLGSDRVVETSGLNLTGEYIGQTKKKVEEQLNQARGAILFIDEAYELGKGHYGEEAMTTLVAAMTDPTYTGMVIIMAGYPADMNAMLDRNAGLKSRFTRFLDFADWEASDCIAYIRSQTAREKYALAEGAVEILRGTFTVMRQLPGFGNGRDVDKVWKSILECRAQRVIEEPELERTITLTDLAAASQRVLAAREPPKAERLNRPDMTGVEQLRMNSAACEPRQTQPTMDATTDQAENDSVEEETKEKEDDEASGHVERDPGVSDEVWEELEQAKQAYKQLLQDVQNVADRKKEEEARRKVEAYQATQEKLRQLSKCPAGYEWRQLANGWRCAGGSHYVTNERLEKMTM